MIDEAYRRWPHLLVLLNIPRYRWIRKALYVAGLEMDDVNQACWMALIKTQHKCDETRPIEPWVREVTYQTCRSLLANTLKKKRARPTATDLDSVADPRKKVDIPWDYLSDETARRVKKHYYGGMTYKEIGLEENVGVTTVHRSISQGLTLLKEIMSCGK